MYLVSQFWSPGVLQKLPGQKLSLIKYTRSYFKNMPFPSLGLFANDVLTQSMLPLVKVTQSCLTLCDPMDYTVRGILQARILEWVPFTAPGIFPTQGSNPDLPHCRQILYQLSHKGSPRILEWVACPCCKWSSCPRNWPSNWTRVSCTVGRFFTSWATREVLYVFSIITWQASHKMASFLFGETTEISTEETSS